MRTTRLLLFLGLCSCPAACDRAEPAATSGEALHVHGQPEHGFEFLEPQHPAHPNWIDLGEIEMGEVRDALVRMKNVEAVPITITSLDAGCTCTLPEISYVDAKGERVVGDIRARDEVLKVPPGATAELALRVDSRLAPIKNKPKLVVIRITTDFDPEPYLSVEARMQINAAFQSVPFDLDLKRVGVNAGAEGVVEIAPVVGHTRRLLKVAQSVPGIEAALEPSSRQGSETWLLRARAVPPVEAGYHEGLVQIESTGEDGQGSGHPYEVKVRWNGVADVEVVPTRLLVQRDPQNGQEQARADILSHMPGQRLKVVRHELVGERADQIEASIEPVEPDALGRSNQWVVILKPKSSAGTQAVSGTLVIELDDPQFPRFEIPITRRGT